MANHSVDQFASLINKQVELQTKVQDYLLKIDAIAQVTLGEDFLDCERSTLHDYLWALSDMIHESRLLQEQSLNELLQGDIRYWFPQAEFGIS